MVRNWNISPVWNNIEGGVSSNSGSDGSAISKLATVLRELFVCARH